MYKIGRTYWDIIFYEEKESFNPFYTDPIF